MRERPHLIFAADGTTPLALSTAAMHGPVTDPAPRRAAALMRRRRRRRRRHCGTAHCPPSPCTPPTAPSSSYHSAMCGHAGGRARQKLRRPEAPKLHAGASPGPAGAVTSWRAQRLAAWRSAWPQAVVSREQPAIQSDVRGARGLPGCGLRVRPKLPVALCLKRGAERGAGT